MFLEPTTNWSEKSKQMIMEKMSQLKAFSKISTNRCKISTKLNKNRMGSKKYKIKKLKQNKSSKEKIIWSHKKINKLLKIKLNRQKQIKSKMVNR